MRSIHFSHYFSIQYAFKQTNYTKLLDTLDKTIQEQNYI